MATRSGDALLHALQHPAKVKKVPNNPRNGAIRPKRSVRLLLNSRAIIFIW